MACVSLYACPHQGSLLNNSTQHKPATTMSHLPVDRISLGSPFWGSFPQARQSAGSHPDQNVVLSRAIEAASDGSTDVVGMAFWWSNCIQLRWMLWAMSHGGAEAEDYGDDDTGPSGAAEFRWVQEVSRAAALDWQGYHHRTARVWGWRGQETCPVSEHVYWQASGKAQDGVVSRLTGGGCTRQHFACLRPAQLRLEVPLRCLGDASEAADCASRGASMAAVLKQHEEVSPCPAEAVWHHPPNTLAGRQKGTVGTQRREMVGLSVLLSLMLFCWRL